MRKSILVVLIAVMITIPCFAQGIEPEGNFSIEGTEWQALPTGLQILPFPFVWIADGLEFGFHGGEAYLYDVPRESSFYVDILGCSIFYIEGTMAPGGYERPSYYGILQLFGVGTVIEMERFCFGYHCSIPAIAIRVGMLIKTNDKWTPPGYLYYINPSDGEQGTVLTIVIMGQDTTFQDNPPVEIIFEPPYGLTVSNINVISNTEIEFDVVIAIDAPISRRDLIVIYDDGNKDLEMNSVFRVYPKSN